MRPLFISILIFFPFFYLHSQCNECEVLDGEIWVIVDLQKTVINNNQIEITDDNLNQLFEDYKVESIIKVFPYSRKEYLQRIYKIRFEGKSKEFAQDLKTLNNGHFKKILTRPKENKVTVYDPSDYMWQSHSDDWLWHLSDIQADLAWDVNKGDPEIKVAILDTWFDINHPDLADKISPLYDPYDNTWYTTNCLKNNHGTAVASFVAAHTDGGGQLAGVGFNSMMICYQAWDGNYIERAHDASLRMNADVLTSSAGGWYCGNSTTFDSIEYEVVNEIIENGTIIVMPAGNGEYGTHCRHSGDTIDSPFFPLNPKYNSNIIIVTSIGEDNNHYYYCTYHSRDESHSHYPEVDICSPGYFVMAANCTEDVCTTGCCTDTWPYYGGAIGTSFATPIVAGVCALMKSIDPCMTQAEAQYIIKSTADAVNDANLYPGLIGAGRINAFEAVKGAVELATTYFKDEILSSSQTTESQYGISFENVTISSGTHIFKTRNNISIEGPFQVSLGVTCTFDVDEDNIISCD